jgi:hypothetical protein
VYNNLHQYLVERGFKPQLQKLDNKASNTLKRSICEKELTINQSHHTFTDETRQKEQSKLSKTISSGALAPPTKAFPFTYGIAFCHKPSQLLIFLNLLASTPDFQYKHT